MVEQYADGYLLELLEDIFLNTSVFGIAALVAG